MAHRVAATARIAAVLLLLAALLFSLAMAWNTAGWPVSIAEALAFALTGITALRAMVTRKVRLPWPAVGLFAASIWIAGQLCFGQSVYWFGTVQSLLAFLSIACAFWSTLQLLENGGALRAFRTLLLSIGTATAALSIVNIITGNGRVYWVIDTLDSWRPMGPFLNANHNSVFMELLLPLAAWEALQSVRKGYIYAIAAALMYSSVIVAASRAGIILATCEIAILLVLSVTRRSSGRRGAIAGSVLLVCVIGGAVLADGGRVLRRFQTNDIFQQRRELLQSTVMMIREHPAAGSGLGTWAIVYPGFAVFEPGLAVYHAHNEWAEWMAEGGVPFVALLWSVIIRAVLLIRRFPWGLGVAAGAVHAFVDFPFHVYPDLLCFFLVAALMEAAIYSTPGNSPSQRGRPGPDAWRCAERPPAGHDRDGRDCARMVGHRYRRLPVNSSQARLTDGAPSAEEGYRPLMFPGRSPHNLPVRVEKQGVASLSYWLLRPAWFWRRSANCAGGTAGWRFR